MFTPEDGSGSETANSYTDVAYADAFHADRGNSAWGAADQTAKETALVRATDYIDANYTFAGTPANDEQALAWPRDIAGYDDDIIPTKIKQATCLLALTALNSDLNPDIAPNAGVKRKKVDVLEVEYFESKVSRTVRPAIDGLLKGFLANGGAAWNVRVVRV